MNSTSKKPNQKQMLLMQSLNSNLKRLSSANSNLSQHIDKRPCKKQIKGYSQISEQKRLSSYSQQNDDNYVNRRCLPNSLFFKKQTQEDFFKYQNQIGNNFDQFIQTKGIQNFEKIQTVTEERPAFESFAQKLALQQTPQKPDVKYVYFNLNQEIDKFKQIKNIQAKRNNK